METSQLSRKAHQKLPHYLFLFPLVASLAWSTTVSILLIYWIAIGKPRFPRQNNPYIAFISNIAAFHLKPLFITGSTITSITFLGTIFSLNYAKNSPRFYGSGSHESNWKKLVAILTMVFGLIAAVSLFCLSLFDTYRTHRAHLILLLCTFGNLGLAAIGTGFVWGDVWLGWKRVRQDGVVKTNATKWLRTWCAINFGVMVVVVVLSILFTTFLSLRWWRAAGLLEWTVTYFGCLWLLTFAGLLYRMRDDDREGTNGVDDVDDTHEEEHIDTPEFQVQPEPVPVPVPASVPAPVPVPESQSESQSKQPNSYSEQILGKSVDWERAPLLTER